MRRVSRWAVRMVSGLLLLVATSALAVETEWGKERLRRIVINRAAEALNGQVAIGRLTGSLLTGVELHQVLLTQAGGPVLAVDTLALRYDPRLLFRGHLVFSELSLTRPVVHIAERHDGWNVATLAKPTSGGKKTEIHFRKLSIVDGRLIVEPKAKAARRLTHVNAGLGLTYSADGVQMNVDTLSGQDPDTGLVVRGGAVKFESSEKGMKALLQLDSSAGAIDGTVAGQSPDGAARVAGEGGRVLDAHFNVARLNLAPFAATPNLASDISGTLQVQARLPQSASAVSTISFQVDASSVLAAGYAVRDVKGSGSFSDGVLHLDAAGSAYDAFATIKGEWRTASARHAPDTMVFAGRVRELDLRRVPASFQVPTLASRVAGQYSFSYRPAGWEAAIRFDRSTLEGAQIAAGTVAHAAVRGRVPRYDARGHIANLDLRRLGRPLRIAVLSEPRFRGRITGDVQVEGQGRTLNNSTLAANVKLEDSTIGPTRIPSATLAANLAGRRLVIDFAGPFEHVTNELTGMAETTPLDLTGQTEGVRIVFHDLNRPINLYTIEASGHVTLSPSIIVGYDVDRADLDAALADGLATIRTLRVDGAELQAAASGTVGFDAEADSHLTFTVDAANLETAAKRAGQPIGGAAHVEGKIAGSPDHLTASGTFATQQFTYGTSVDALTLNGTFGADVVNQQWRDVTLHADTQATFLKLGSLDIDQMTAITTFHSGSLDIDTTIDQKARRLQLAGSVLFQPEQEEIRLRKLGLTTSGQTWSLPAGREAVIQYAANRVGVEGLALKKGNEAIGVSGALAMGGRGPVSSPGLDVKAENVQLADLNQLLSGKWTVAGVLNGAGHVSGTTRAPDLTSTFTVGAGSVSNTTFQSLAAKVAYRDNRLTLDATLDQQPGAQLRAVGSVPVALGGSTTIGNEAVDLHVESTPIDLGLFQPFTTELSALKGTGQFDVRVTGTPKAPQVNGSLAIASASFTAEAMGTKYTGGNARLRFDGDHVLIDQFVLEDDDRHVLTAEGGAEVAAGARAVRSLDVHITSRDFHLLRNSFGELGLDVDLKAAGALSRLEITGDARIERGRLEVDKLLERFNKTAYPTESEENVAVVQAANQVSPEPAPPAVDKTPAQQVGQAASGSLFDNATINVSLRMPDDLVLRARDLRLAEGEAGLGSTNLTLGGTLNLRKDPGGSLTILGGVEVVRGFYDFQGRRFDIVRGSDVQFHGNVPIDPALNVSAERDISGVTTQVGVRGTIREPEIRLSSYPPLDQSDILSLIVFGQPVNSLGESQRVNLAQRAGSLALGALATPLADSVGRALNLDLFEIRAEGAGGGPEVALGSQVGSRMFIGLRQEFGKDEMSTVSFEYRLSKLLRLVTSVAQGQPQTHATRRSDPTGMDVIFVIRY